MVMIEVGDPVRAKEIFAKGYEAARYIVYSIKDDEEALYESIDRQLMDAVETERRVLQRHIIGHETAQTERTVWTDTTVSHRHRRRNSMMDAWGEWMEGTGE